MRDRLYIKPPRYSGGMWEICELTPSEFGQQRQNVIRYSQSLEEALRAIGESNPGRDVYLSVMVV